MSINHKYDSYILSKEWKIKRKQALDFHGDFCSQCKSKKDLHVHHKTYANLGNEPMEDLVILCRDCHYVEHNPYLKVQEELKLETQVQTKQSTLGSLLMFVIIAISIYLWVGLLRIR